jgi:hypothetical protein
MSLTLRSPPGSKEIGGGARRFCRFAVHTQAWSSLRVEGLRFNLTLNPQPSTLNPQPSTLNPKLSLNRDNNSELLLVFEDISEAKNRFVLRRTFLK